jgi:hypothetical protein
VSSTRGAEGERGVEVLGVAGLAGQRQRPRSILQGRVGLAPCQADAAATEAAVALQVLAAASGRLRDHLLHGVQRLVPAAGPVVLGYPFQLDVAQVRDAAVAFGGAPGRLPGGEAAGRVAEDGPGVNQVEVPADHVGGALLLEQRRAALHVSQAVRVTMVDAGGADGPQRGRLDVVVATT